MNQTKAHIIVIYLWCLTLVNEIIPSMWLDLSHSLKKQLRWHKGNTGQTWVTVLSIKKINFFAHFLVRLPAWALTLLGCCIFQLKYPDQTLKYFKGFVYERSLWNELIHNNSYLIATGKDLSWHPFIFKFFRDCSSPAIELEAKVRLFSDSFRVFNRRVTKELSGTYLILLIKTCLFLSDATKNVLIYSIFQWF